MFNHLRSKSVLFVLAVTMLVGLPSAWAAPSPEPRAVASSANAATSASAQGTSEFPPATISNDQGGPKRLTGAIDYTNFGVATTLQDPAPALVDMVYLVTRDKTKFAPVQGQILGRMTSPVAPPPISYEFDLPVEPAATYVDVDNNAKKDKGVQIFQLLLGANINGGSYLEQLDQSADLKSFLTDPTTGEITRGTFLIYAPDDEQGFPSGLGKDGLLFTADDPVVGVPQGYTVVHVEPNGFTFDRSAVAELDVLEEPSEASSDFSKQGLVESFNNLLDELAVRYSYTKERNLDWEAIRAEYLPQIQQAEQVGEQNPALALGGFSSTLHQLAQSVHDAHVVSVITDPRFAAAVGVANTLNLEPIATNVGANTTELSDGRIIVTDVAPNSPAAEAGWTLGTQIISVDGTPVEQRLPSVVYNEATGTPEGQRLFQVNNLLKFPAPGQDGKTVPVKIEAIPTGSSSAQSFTLTPGSYALPNRTASPSHAMPISFQIAPSYGYLTWDGFREPEVRIAVMEEFLSEYENALGVHDGIVLDLRGNGGGWDNLYFTMASYFFDAEHPVSMHWIDMDRFDTATGTFVPTQGREYLISTPQENLYYDGPIVILVDQNCESSCEFFSQFLQVSDRATVVAQHGTAGAGAPINRVMMPGGSLFQYTKARSYFAGTNEANLEAKGVTPDIRVPVTIESEQALRNGSDPLLAAAVQTLSAQAAERYTAALKWVPVPSDAITSAAAVYPEGWTPSVKTPDRDFSFTAPDGQHVLAYAIAPGRTAAEVLPLLGIADPKSALAGTHQANGLDWSIYSTPDPTFGYRKAVAEANGTVYVVTMAVPLSRVEKMEEEFLIHVLDAFKPANP